MLSARDDGLDLGRRNIESGRTLGRFQNTQPSAGSGTLKEKAAAGAEGLGDSVYGQGDPGYLGANGTGHGCVLVVDDFQNAAGIASINSGRRRVGLFVSRCSNMEIDFLSILFKVRPRRNEDGNGGQQIDGGKRTDSAGQPDCLFGVAQPYRGKRSGREGKGNKHSRCGGVKTRLDHFIQGSVDVGVRRPGRIRTPARARYTVVKLEP